MMTNPDETTTPTKKARPISWLVWYTVVVLGLSALVARGDALTFIYLATGNWALWVLPTWAVVAIVRRLRKK